MTAATTSMVVVAAASAALIMFGAVGVTLQWRLEPGDPRRARPSRHVARRRTGALRTRRRRRDVDAGRQRAGIAVLEHTARDLRAGRSLSTALAEALEAHPTVLGEVRDGLRRGTGASAALDAALAAGCTTTADEGLLLRALGVCRHAGRSAPDVLERAADVLRERQAWRRERQSQAAHARLSARVLTVLPIVFALWSVASDDAVRAAYRMSPLPAVSAAVGVALNLFGWWWMRRLTGRGL